MDDRLDRRLTGLEVRLTFIDDAVQGLAHADARQSARMVLLERMMEQMRAELTALRVDQTSDPHSEPPPHY